VLGFDRGADFWQLQTFCRQKTEGGKAPDRWDLLALEPGGSSRLSLAPLKTFE